MPWAETSAVQERIRFVKDDQSGLYPRTELCARFGVSRQTGYKGVDRYLEQGAAGLEDRSRAPHHCPHRMSPAAGKRDPTGAGRRREADRGHALAGRSTLNRLELTPADASATSRYKKIVYDGAAIDDLFVDHFLDAHERPPEPVLLRCDGRCLIGPG